MENDRVATCGRPWRMLAGLLLACLSFAAVAAPRSVELSPDSGTVALAPHVRYYHDVAGDLGADAVWTRVEADALGPLPDGNGAFGFQSGAFWFHVRVVNRDPAQTRWLLVQEYPLSDQVDVHVRRADGYTSVLAGGDHRPFSARSIRYRHPNFALDLPVDVPVDLLVRVESQSSMQVPLQLYTPAAFTEVSRDAQFAIGLYYGILLALFFYNLVLWLWLHDASYFW